MIDFAGKAVLSTTHVAHQLIELSLVPIAGAAVVSEVKKPSVAIFVVLNVIRCLLTVVDFISEIFRSKCGLGFPLPINH
jgi:hypothetical protein